MSIAGVHSNRGDIYQTLIAFDWAIKVFSDPSFQWLEVDSILFPEVDDVVIGKTDGTLICCQCKKNQSDFKAWSFSDLKNELEKTINLLCTNEMATAHFYSRDSFGGMANLRDYIDIQSDKGNYYKNLSQKLQKVDSDLNDLITEQGYNFSSYDLIKRITFETTFGFEKLEDLLRERLNAIVSNSDNAYNALWTRLAHLGGCMGGDLASGSNNARLTKEDLNKILIEAGAIKAPIVDIKEAKMSFLRASSIGRNWQRDIAGKTIPMPIIDDLLSAISEKKKSILLTGAPGSGKTCVLLSLMEKLEGLYKNRSDIVPIFIQSREFADLKSQIDREAQGFPKQFFETTARLAEESHVIVIIDSLDVLSISREHSALTFFLSQIDQLLQISNVSIVTACRNFDRQYDYRIAVRNWEYELECPPLDWGSQIVPLLEAVGIAPEEIDKNTHELILNPRELDLYVTLVKKEGNVSSVTSQDLAQRYLEAVISTDPHLGRPALEAVEDIADEMLKNRSLVVPVQRFKGSEFLPNLRSANILREKDGGLSFGHQTLLDVLVISRAIHNGITLSEFIENLPPVPFVRPSIRSFVAHLASGNRKTFRKQIRAVLTSSSAFHIRRLIAESVAEQIPTDDDWPLIRDLKINHNEVFQVIYMKTQKIEWLDFWDRNLVPMLTTTNDYEGLVSHAYKISIWENNSPEKVINFWMELLKMQTDNEERIRTQIEIYLSDIRIEYSKYIVPILEILIDKPKSQHNFLGRSIAKCVHTGVINDSLLWKYISGDVTDEDVRNNHFNKKLFCAYHHFGDKDKDFLSDRMKHSENLLDLAITSILEWNKIKYHEFGRTGFNFTNGFLSYTSYEMVHTKHDTYPVDDETILFKAVEVAIFYHAENHSDWWKNNSESIAFCNETALRYFIIIACTRFPEFNMELIGRILTDKELLESELSYELGCLIKKSFVYLTSDIQHEIIEIVSNIHSDYLSDEENKQWVERNRAEMFKTIPCHLRSPEAQRLLDSFENMNGTLHIQPRLHAWGGLVSAPFSYTAFLTLSDDAIVCILKHYTEYKRDLHDYPRGGSTEVSSQLREAASRSPSKFLNILKKYRNIIGKAFCENIIDGISNYLAYQYGNLTPNKNWEPLEQTDSAILVHDILTELETQSGSWNKDHSASNALQACAHVVDNKEDGERIVFLSLGFKFIQEYHDSKDDYSDLINVGINMSRGHVAEALIIIANRFTEKGILLPELLVPALFHFSNDDHPAVRAVILRRLPYLLYYRPDLGWDLLESLLQASEGLWPLAESCLYQMYHKNFDKVGPLLDRILKEGKEKDFETWGRISALAAIGNFIDINDFIRNLEKLNSSEAWDGALMVWTHSGNFKQKKESCLLGIRAGFTSNMSIITTQNVTKMFLNKDFVFIPMDIIEACLTVAAENDKEQNMIHGLEEWLNTLSQYYPEQALDGIEAYVKYAKQAFPYMLDYKNNLTQLMTRLFAEAEEKEESDNGDMLLRVVSVQDRLLSLGINGIQEWLEAAERP